MNFGSYFYLLFSDQKIYQIHHLPNEIIAAGSFFRAGWFFYPWSLFVTTITMNEFCIRIFRYVWEYQDKKTPGTCTIRIYEANMLSFTLSQHYFFTFYKIYIRIFKTFSFQWISLLQMYVCMYVSRY